MGRYGRVVAGSRSELKLQIFRQLDTLCSHRPVPVVKRRLPPEEEPRLVRPWA
ncbi:hypothetical protein [Streptomyces sp. NBC_01443]|uniref:hypothetical protein n=1 Tax=Streptomyces sp. NBC_01443 TaxID=2903868 RepID=UPI00224EEA5D|nr:hypothetical protein [Streptomyces sp. NBC_01443]MCX4633185.1 hypothetical protein [Streptomyces sp. NBC_01443]